MKFTKTDLTGVLAIDPKVYADGRGYFMESYQKKLFADNGITSDFVQDNHSLSSRGVLRGLHYQLPPMAQGKLVRVTRGSIYDVVVDMRRDSGTFGRWIGETLSADNHRMLWIPSGCAHGFCTLEDHTEVQYKVTEFYSPACERGIIWNDPDLGIRWPDTGCAYVISQKDGQYPAFGTAFYG